MPKNKSASSKPTNIKVGNISNIRGNINVAGGDITTHQTTTSLSETEIKQLFDKLYAQIDERADTSVVGSEDIKAEVKEIQATVTKAAQTSEKIDEGFLSRRFRNIARVAPDVLDVVVAMLTNPLAGLGIAVSKVAQKAKEEAKQTG